MQFGFFVGFYFTHRTELLIMNINQNNFFFLHRIKNT